MPFHTPHERGLCPFTHPRKVPLPYQAPTQDHTRDRVHARPNSFDARRTLTTLVNTVANTVTDIETHAHTKPHFAVHNPKCPHHRFDDRGSGVGSYLLSYRMRHFRFAKDWLRLALEVASFAKNRRCGILCGRSSTPYLAHLLCGYGMCARGM